MDIQKIFLILGVCLAFITTFGFFGNVLSFYIWTRGQRCSKRQGAVYLRLLALADTLVLCVPAMELTVMLLGHTILLRNSHPVLCKIFPISPYFCVQLSAWIVVSLTVEQTIAVCRPFKIKTSPSKWRQYGIVIIIAIVSFLDNIPVLLANNWSAQEDFLPAANTSDIVNNSTVLTSAGKESTLENNTQGFTTGDSPFKTTEHHVYMYICVTSFDIPEHVYIVRLGVIAILPILILGACNIIIVTTLFKRDKELTNVESRKDGRCKSANSLVAAMTARTVAISITQCITAIPIVSMDIFVLLNPTNDTLFVIYYVCNTVYYLNNAINVIFYCLMGKSFRQDCGDMFKRRPLSGDIRHTAVQTVSSSVRSSVM